MAAQGSGISFGGRKREDRGGKGIVSGGAIGSNDGGGLHRSGSGDFGLTRQRLELSFGQRRRVCVKIPGALAGSRVWLEKRRGDGDGFSLQTRTVQAVSTRNIYLLSDGGVETSKTDHVSQDATTHPLERWSEDSEEGQGKNKM